MKKTIFVLSLVAIAGCMLGCSGSSEPGGSNDLSGTFTFSATFTGSSTPIFTGTASLTQTGGSVTGTFTAACGGDEGCTNGSMLTGTVSGTNVTFNLPTTCFGNPDDAEPLVLTGIIVNGGSSLSGSGTGLGFTQAPNGGGCGGGSGTWTATKS